MGSGFDLGGSRVCNGLLWTGLQRLLGKGHEIYAGLFSAFDILEWSIVVVVVVEWSKLRHARHVSPSTLGTTNLSEEV